MVRTARGEAVKRERSIAKRGGWNGSPSKPLTLEGKKQRAKYLHSWSLEMGQLLFAEAERR
jgi:hypothetical protein